jgi:hypothetical protein
MAISCFNAMMCALPLSPAGIDKDDDERIRAYIVDDAIDIAGAQLPAGTHPFRVDVKDSRGRRAVAANFRIRVAK